MRRLMKRGKERETRPDRKAARRESGKPTENPPEAMEGMQIGVYRIERRLETGGMGEVFLARDHRLDRPVAIKRTRRDGSATDQYRERLWREARAVARLNHPAIAQVYDVVFDEHGDSIVMEYIEGQTLANLMAAGLIDGAAGLDIAVQIAEGLVAAHDHGLVHRDLKAENVMVTAATHTAPGRVKILDFGLVKQMTEESDLETLTQHGIVVGTVGSMSPEQARGGSIDQRSDLFSLGVLLYEIFTGYSPFRGSSWMATLENVKRAKHTAPQVVRQELPESLDLLIERLLAREPDDRPADGRQVMEALVEIGAKSRLRSLPAPAARARRGTVSADSNETTGSLASWVAASSWLARPPSFASRRWPILGAMPPAALSVFSVISVLALATVLLLWLARPAPGPSWPELIAAARQEIAAERPAGARELLDEMLRRSPDDVEALSLRAQLELRYGEPWRADELYRRLLTLGERSALHDDRGTALFLMGRYEAAAASFGRALEMAPGDPVIRFHLGVAELTRGRLDEGRRLLGETEALLLRRPAADRRLLAIRAGCLIRLGRETEALEIAGTIAGDDGPVHLSALLNVAEVFALAGDYESTLVVAKRVLARGLSPSWLTTPAFSTLATDPSFEALISWRGSLEPK